MQRGAVDAPQSKGFEIALGCPATALILGLVEEHQKGDPAARSQDGVTGWSCSPWAWKVGWEVWISSVMGWTCFLVRLNGIKQAVVSYVLIGNVNVLHSSCAPHGNAAELSCHRAVPACCRSPGKREVASEVFVGVAGRADELTMAVLGVWRGKGRVTQKCQCPGVVTQTRLWKGMWWELNNALSWWLVQGTQRDLTLPAWGSRVWLQ